ncbi:hypothetical protein [Lederbergia lenta]|uniref:Uncharacterized protein n=1 Tax=Lederbergia lenta TaxID=1467 RepID=A0A2X4WHQ2_LEDLE|nr:hypothetical protein [Lederbergia lenta]MEC2323085.1 hypothetical protein [Lederbergia lenta]SQI62681.1 Uncharacterised protein [Lederbergia lenta]
MPTLYQTFQRRQHGGGAMKPVSTAITYGVASHNNIPVSVYSCMPCIATCMKVSIRLQRVVTSAVYETIGTYLNRDLCDSRVGPGRVDHTFTNVRKSGAAMRVLWQLDGSTDPSSPFYHD